MAKTAHCAALSTHDLSVLREFVGDDPATLARFVGLGLHSLDQVLRPLQDMHAGLPPLGLLREAAHRAKSTARQLGADAWAHECEALECAARDGQQDAAAARYTRLMQAWPLLRAQLHASMEQLQALARPAG
ncbi:MAG: hypothetical protein ACT4NV_11260 [Rhodoferax sp.]